MACLPKKLRIKWVSKQKWFCPKTNVTNVWGPCEEITLSSPYVLCACLSSARTSTGSSSTHLPSHLLTLPPPGKSRVTANSESWKQAKWKDVLQNNCPLLFKSVQGRKGKDRLRNCHRLKEAKEMRTKCNVGSSTRRKPLLGHWWNLNMVHGLDNTLSMLVDFDNCTVII